MRPAAPLLPCAPDAAEAGAALRPREISVGRARRVRLELQGSVQGVGFRPHVFRLAQELGLGGLIANTPGGVTIEVEGPGQTIERFLAGLRAARAPIAVGSIISGEAPVQGQASFEIRPSDSSGRISLELPRDLAICDACSAELLDPADRRFQHPFISCTACGPRFTLIESLPYDRPRTTMADFAPCPDCAAEYRDSADRRFHAEPIACPRCGPAIEWRGHESTREIEPAIARAARSLASGGVIAFKGVGGFHLLANARNESAVARLRRIKLRPAKPFAVIYPDIERLEADARLTSADRAALRSPAAPIVLVDVRPGASLAPGVAPGSTLVGAMIAYSPAHVLLCRDFGGPLVATSANLGDEPILTDNDAVLARFGDAVDGLILHDRRIARPADDSVVRVIDGAPTPLRVGRGLAPACVPVGPALCPPVDADVLALGAYEKASIAIARSGSIFLSQHLGDLDAVASREAYAAAIEDYIRLFDLQPRLVVCDAHPDYFSSRLAVELSGRFACEHLSIQHHAAHALSALLDENLPPAAGALILAWDGTGLGDDGTLWGGEAFMAEPAQPLQLRRVASLLPFALPGGERAVREPWRVAISLLDAAGAENFVPLAIPDRSGHAPDPLRLHGVHKLLRSGSPQPVTSSVGRLFDGVASLLGLRHRAEFSAQAAMELEQLAVTAVPRRAYPLAWIHDGAITRLDALPLVRAIASDIAAGVDRAVIASTFHHALAGAIAELADRRYASAVFLTGGCFQNRLLAELAASRLRVSGRSVHFHRRLPPNDGGLAAGQALAGLLHLSRQRS